jgi:hypothetical protein
VIGNRLEIPGVAHLEPAVHQAELRGPSVPGLHQVLRNIHAEDFRARLRSRQSGGAVAAAEIEHPPAFPDADSPYERLAALMHGRRNTREVSLFPESLIRIRRYARREILHPVTVLDRTVNGIERIDQPDDACRHLNQRQVLGLTLSRRLVRAKPPDQAVRDVRHVQQAWLFI